MWRYTYRTVYPLHLWCIPAGKHAPQPCFLTKPLLKSSNYHWIFILNLHLIKVRPTCTFSNKSLIISKPYWLIPWLLYLCCIAHHTFYTSEHHFLLLHKYQYYRSERRSRGLSPRSCLEKTRIQRSLKYNRLHRHFNTRKKKRGEELNFRRT